MFSNTLIAFLLGVGFAAWLYSKLMRSTGGNTKSAVIAAGLSALILFVLALMLLNLIPGTN